MEMTSFERLVASDPQRAGAYAPRDFDAMITRVLAQPYARVLSWRAFKARVLAGFTASCAVMAGATYALAGAGPPLLRLTFAAAPVKAAQAPTYATTLTGSGFVASMPRLLAGAISTTAPSLAAFTVTAPSSERDAVATLAHAIGVSLAAPVAKVPAPPGTHNEWTARGEPGMEAIFVRVGGVDLWGYEPLLSTETPSAPSGVAAPPSAPRGLSGAALAQRALNIVHALGTLDTGVPIVGTGATFVPGAPTKVVVPILIDERWSNLSDQLLLDARGRVISALGVMFSLGPPVAYPLISPRAAASHASAQAAIFAHEVTPLGWPGYEPSGASLATGALRLTQSTAQYRILVDARGVAHALPIYQYVGRSSTSREVVLDALAIDPRFLAYEVHGSVGP
jgi:hypothetical protein